jgi:hypothetical protein
VPLIGDLVTVAWPGNAPAESSLALSVFGRSPSEDLGISWLYKPRTRDPVSVHHGPKDWGCSLDPRIGAPHSLHSWAAFHARTFTHSQSTILLSCSLNLKGMVSSQKAVTKVSH